MFFCYILLISSVICYCVLLVRKISLENVYFLKLNGYCFLHDLTTAPGAPRCLAEDGIVELFRATGTCLRGHVLCVLLGTEHERGISQMHSCCDSFQRCQLRKKCSRGGGWYRVFAGEPFEGQQL